MLKINHQIQIEGRDNGINLLRKVLQAIPEELSTILFSAIVTDLSQILLMTPDPTPEHTADDKKVIQRLHNLQMEFLHGEIDELNLEGKDFIIQTTLYVIINKIKEDFPFPTKTKSLIISLLMQLVILCQAAAPLPPKNPPKIAYFR